MSRYVLKRVLQALVVIWLVSVFVFVISRVIGNPVDMMLPIEATKEDRQRLIEAYGLDKPIYVQYGRFIIDLAHGDFGQSYKWGQPAMQMVLQRTPATLVLAGAALGFALFIGVTAGILSAIRPGSWVDRIAMGGALLGQAAPTFWIGIMLILLFSVKLGWLPTGGKGGITHLIMPAFTLGVYSSAVLARLSRSRMREVLTQEYVKLAYLKGLGERKVILKHAFRNVSVPLLTMTGLELGTMLGGAVITESVFYWPGIGRLAVEAVVGRDYTVVQAVALFVSVAFVGLNLVIDLCYGFLDPRIRLAKRAA